MNNAVIDMGIIKPLTTNILITMGSCIIPIIVGILSNYICKQNEGLSKLARLAGAMFESFCPLFTIFVMYYCVFRMLRSNPIWICIIGFTISFIGYIPSRYNKEYSFAKNTIVNSIDLVAVVFKWSFCANYIGVLDMFRYANLQFARLYRPSAFWFPFSIAFVCVMVLKLVKFIAEEKL